MTVQFSLLTLLLLTSATLLTAQSDSSRAKSDSIKVYKLGQVEVLGGKRPAVTTSTIQQLPFATIKASDAATLDEVAYRIPAARIQTNSRGESLLYLRNAGERQVALFFDGALMNIPWDNRIDMSLIPLDALGGITISKGVPSVLYGANVIGGAVNISSQELETPGHISELHLSLGENGFLKTTATHVQNFGEVNLIGSFGYVRRDALALPKLSSLTGNSELPFEFHQTDPDARTNSDSRTASIYLRGEYRPDATAAIGVSFSMTDAEKGVPPEGHVVAARFWRYPEWRSITVGVNSDLDFGEENRWNLRSSFWWNGFHQAIDQFSSESYQRRTDREEDDDRTVGTRVLFGYQTPNNRVTLSFNGYFSGHDQRDLRFDSTGGLVPFRDSTGAEIAYPTLAYQQRLFSTGAEIESRIAERLSVVAGIAYDFMATPETGDKPARDGFSGVQFTGGTVYRITDNHAIRFSAGRKSRFPTMRELYGEALRRFLVNPDLKPEEAGLLELGSEGSGSIGRYGVTGFMSVVRNTIDQRTIDTLGAKRRQRINLRGSSTYGVEITGSLATLHPLRIDGHFTLAHARGRALAADGADSTFLLSEKPDYTGTLGVTYTFPFGLEPALELLATGEAFGLNDDNTFVSLGSSLVANARISYRWFSDLTKNFTAQLFIRANNIFDTTTIPQIGLPAPGRTIIAGINVTL
jgi:iron complex outermembrane receptor protein